MLQVYSAEIMIMEAAYMTYLLLLCCTCTTAMLGTGIVITHSTGLKANIAPVCSGDELEFICTLTSGIVIEWSVSPMPPKDMTFQHVIDSVILIFPVHTIIVNGSVMFTFSRISPPNTLPLISRLLISPATSIINGTEVVCTDRVTRNSSSTTVNIVYNTNMDTLTAVHVVNFTLLSELREITSVSLSVSLHLIRTDPSFPYHINIIPEERNIPVTNVIQTIELRMQYDILYNVSLAVCGESSGPLIGLYYPRCGTSPAIIDYDGHLQGTLKNTTDCLQADSETSQAPTGENSTGLEKISELRSVNVLTAAISSTVVAVLVIIILTFVVGFVCGHYFGRKSKRSSRETPDGPTGNQQAPLYEDVLLSVEKHQEQDLELKENVAYGPSKSIIKSVN